MKVKLTTIHVTEGTKEVFKREAAARGLKLYSAVDEALRLWAAKSKKKEAV